MMPEQDQSMETVIGLEIHIQLRTREKLFCGDPVAFGAEPNSQVCPVCLGLPGALPVVNGQAVALAVRACLAFGCTVHPVSVFARKNYFYPDLPKGYQISQFERPLATGGEVRVRMDEEGTEVPIRIRRIHLEEDAGKSIHDRFPGATAVDLNRTGTPLIEMVSEPDFRSPAQVRIYLDQVKRTLAYLGVSDCNMEEGSLRVDANVSIRPRGTVELGTKTELKNMNSFSGVEKALRVEMARQRSVVARGEAIEHQTLLWDERKAEVRPMRSKEESHDYRYFPDPDLPPLKLTTAFIERARAALPELPEARRTRFIESHDLPPYDAGVLTADRELADYFEGVAERVGSPKLASNWVMGPVLAAMKEKDGGPGSFPVTPGALAELIGLVEEGVVNRRGARTVLDRMVETGRGKEGDPSEIVEEEGLAQVSDSSQLEGWVLETLAAHPEEVRRFRDGESRLRGFFMGEVMKRSRGRADPGEVARILGAHLQGEKG
jgi:aspartyl-tRNA(Asn)/glutamyl-tRNA(Gln) amidotransferase subunit B